MDINALDSALYHLINQGTANGVFDLLMPFLSAKGYTLILPYAAYMLWCAYKQKRSGNVEIWNLALWTIAVSVSSLLLADWISNDLKPIFGRIRPCHVEDGARLLVGCTQSAAMPSGHAANSFAYALPLFFMTRRFMGLACRVYPLALAGLVAYSRPYVGVHYPGDIIAGAILGIATATLVMSMFFYARIKYTPRPYLTVLYGSLFVLSVFRIYYIIHGPLDLGPDEAHYWEWSRHLDLSYYSKGPLIAYLIALGTAVCGDTVFGVRFPAVIFSAMSSLIIFRLVCKMYQNEAVALWSALIYQVIPLFAAFSIIFSIDSPFLFLWILSLLLFHRAVYDAENEGYGAWIVLGISLGFGLLTKYTMFFFHLAMFLFLAMSEKKYLLKTIKPYAAALISMLVFSPVIIWNARHDWVTIRHTAGQAHIAEGFNISMRSLGEFIGSQIGIVSPLIFMLMLYALYKLYKSKKDYRPVFLAAFSVPIIVFFTLKSVQGKVQANWAMTGYITGIIAMAWFCLTEGDANNVRRKKIFLWAGAISAMIVTAIGYYPSVIKLPVKLDPTARLRGWHQLRQEISPIYGTLSAQGPVLLFSDRYQISSEMAFYVEGHPATYSINLGRRMDQYDLWPGMNEVADRLRREAGSELVNINGIYVTWGDSNVPSPVAKAFERCDRRLMRVYDKGIELRVYSVMICYNFRGFENRPIETY
ncbi:MAG TPA: glycosyltransferase family 39 protein [Dissulfurispiraceae bacterium]|nr:glycosyltransferase family 39 protein [Dissulfurispiraceae bacterium]